MPSCSLATPSLFSSFTGPIKSFNCTPLPSWRHRPKQGHSWKAGRGVITAKFELKPPPYSLDALEPHMSKATLEYHWGKHHRAYVDNLNKQIVGTELDAMSMEDVILATYNKGDLLPPFNNAAQFELMSGSGSWVNFYGNIGKTLLSLVSIFFDVLFIVQHCMLYPAKKEKLPSTGPK